MIGYILILGLIVAICFNKTKPIGIVAFGEVGGGKSTLCNTLIGSNDGSKFPESEDAEAQTMETIGKAGRFGARNTFVIDTPGMGDANRIDSQHLVNMANYIKSNNNTRAFVLVLNFNVHRLADRERKLFELVASMYPNSKWYKHIGVVWSHYYHYLPNDLKKLTQNRREGFKKFMMTYFKDVVPEHEINAIPQFFLDSVQGRKLFAASRFELRRLVSWAQTLPLMSEELPEIKVAKETFSETRTKERRPNPKRIEKDTEQRTCTRFTNGAVECTPWKVIFRSVNERPHA